MANFNPDTCAANPRGGLLENFDLMIGKSPVGRIGVREMRAHAAWYTKGLTGGAELRNLFNRADSAKEFLKIIGSINGR